MRPVLSRHYAAKMHVLKTYCPVSERVIKRQRRIRAAKSAIPDSDRRSVSAPYKGSEHKHKKIIVVNRISSLRREHYFDTLCYGVLRKPANKERETAINNTNEDNHKDHTEQLQNPANNKTQKNKIKIN